MVVTLAQTVERALRHSPAVVEAAGAIDVADAARRTAWGSFLPSLTLGSIAARASLERFDPQTATTVLGSEDVYAAGVTGALDLFTWGRRGAELRRASAESDAADATLVERRFAVILAAKGAFFDAARAHERVRAAEARVRRAEEGRAAAERRRAIGSGTRTDVLQASLELNRALEQLGRAEAERRTARFALGSVIGIDRPAEPEAERFVRPQPLALSPAELRALVAERSPRVRSAQARVGTARASVRTARAAYFPPLRLWAGYDWYNDRFGTTDGQTSWAVAVGFSYPLFDGFERQEESARAHALRSAAEAKLAAARRDALAAAERLLAALELAERRLELAREAVELARQQLAAQEARYRLGAITILERITAQTDLVAAEERQVAARHEYRLTRSQLEALAGREL